MIKIARWLHYNAVVVIQHVLDNYVLQNPTTNDLKNESIYLELKWDKIVFPHSARVCLEVTSSGELD